MEETLNETPVAPVPEAPAEPAVPEEAPAPAPEAAPEAPAAEEKIVSNINVAWRF